MCIYKIQYLIMSITNYIAFSSKIVKRKLNKIGLGYTRVIDNVSNPKPEIIAVVSPEFSGGVNSQHSKWLRAYLRFRISINVQKRER